MMRDLEIYSELLSAHVMRRHHTCHRRGEGGRMGRARGIWSHGGSRGAWERSGCKRGKHHFGSLVNAQEGKGAREVRWLATRGGGGGGDSRRNGGREGGSSVADSFSLVLAITSLAEREVERERGRERGREREEEREREREPRGGGGRKRGEGRTTRTHTFMLPAGEVRLPASKAVSRPPAPQWDMAAAPLVGALPAAIWSCWVTEPVTKATEPPARHTCVTGGSEG